MRAPLALATFATLAVAACGDSSLSGRSKKSSSSALKPDAQTTTIVGTLVAGIDGGAPTPIAGAEVNLAGSTQDGLVKTSPAGTFTLEVPEGQMTTTLALNGLAVNWHAIHPDHHVGVKQTNIPIKLGEANQLGVVTMIPNGGISGRVTPAYVGVGISGASVSVVGTTYTTTTLADGRFELKDLPPAKWVIKVVSKEGTAEKEVDVPSGKILGIGTLGVKK